MAHQQLVACARELFEGVPGSAGQREANAWLMSLQRSDAAWAPALHVLQQPPVESGRVLAAPVLVAVQIVRLKTAQEWPRLPPPHRRLVRDVRRFLCGGTCYRIRWSTDDAMDAMQTLLSLLVAACTSTRDALSPPALRIACVVVADIIVKSGSEWATWKSDLQQIVDASLAQKSTAGAIMVRVEQSGRKGVVVPGCGYGSRTNPCGCVQFEEVVGAIPQQIASSMQLWAPDEQQEVLARFQQEYDHVMFFARTVLSSMCVYLLVTLHVHHVAECRVTLPGRRANVPCDVRCAQEQTRRAQQRAAVYRELAGGLRRITG